MLKQNGYFSRSFPQNSVVEYFCSKNRNILQPNFAEMMIIFMLFSGRCLIMFHEMIGNSKNQHLMSSFIILNYNILDLFRD